MTQWIYSHLPSCPSLTMVAAFQTTNRETDAKSLTTTLIIQAIRPDLPPIWQHATSPAGETGDVASPNPLLKQVPRYVMQHHGIKNIEHQVPLVTHETEILAVRNETFSKSKAENRYINIMVRESGQLLFTLVRR